MYVEKVKGPARREAKLIKILRRNRKLCFHSCSQVHERFLCPQRPHGGDSNMKLPVRKKMAVYTWCTPWLCLWKTEGFPSFSHPKWFWECLPRPGRESPTVFVCTISLTAKEGQTAALQPQPGQPWDKDQPWTTPDSQPPPSATQQGVTVEFSRSRTPTRKTNDCVFLWKATKGYMQQKYQSALLYVLQGPNNFTLMQ